MPLPNRADILSLSGQKAPIRFFCWSCGVKLEVTPSSKERAGPCPRCGEVITTPIRQEKKTAAQCLREEAEADPAPADEATAGAPPEKAPLQVEVYEEMERSSRNILPGLLPTRIGDVLLPAFRVIRPKSRWVMFSIALLALSPLLFIGVFYFPEARSTWLAFEAYRHRQIESVEGQLRASAEAQAERDKKDRLVSSGNGPGRPAARAAQKASSQEGATPKPIPPDPKPLAALALVQTEQQTGTSRTRTVSFKPPPTIVLYDTQLGGGAGGQEKAAETEWPQMLLRNNGIFAGHTPARGACSFLVEGRSATWLATSAQLLGLEGGVAPPVMPEKLAEELHVWRAYFPVDDSSFVDAPGGSSLVSAAGSGLLALKLSTVPATLPATPLKLRHNPPANGEIVYLVGLPSDDHSGASQHLYEGQITSAQQQDPALFGFTLNKPFTLSGFTGAPIIDLRGELVGVLTGGHTSLLIGTKAERLEALIR